MTITRLYLTRHGETTWNLDGERYCSRTEVSLTERGKEQADRLGVLLLDVHFDAAYCSPRERSRETLARILHGQSVPRQVDERVQEMDYGDWEGLRSAEIAAAEPDAWAAWRGNSADVPCGHIGETGRQVLERAMAFLADLRANHPGQTVLVVGHSTLNRVLIAGTLEMPLRYYRRLVQSNAALSIADLEPDQARWRCINRTEPLPGSEPLR
jgi:broad specificity phosphatase PhoE